ncbi:hypothetical protein M3A96_06675 [Helcobacillus massiliensis]|uniref:hypothetical protein n=1 Tax=Helcobacillus massiliensis TaxID=521392 RepID=UPI0021A8B67C|nr:hypothetical protein [Helcobacillus massiliensis]MCT1557797.1 hypothetical protein [Helcobacillus massiliensis]MCT2036965.1 hypothetical protein [Helcobacillus massiliensis]MCT2332178.1 hypothetical protein [Helcobacillus massiliensis]
MTHMITSLALAVSAVASPTLPAAPSTSISAAAAVGAAARHVPTGPVTDAFCTLLPEKYRRYC